MRKLTLCLLSLMMLVGASALIADEVSVMYWKGGVSSPEREIDYARGELESWTWSTGVTYSTGADRDKKSETIKREDIYAVTRTQGDRFRRTLLEGTNAEFEALLTDTEKPLSKFAQEEGWYILATLMQSEKYFSNYITKYPNGNFIEEVRLARADSLISAGGASVAKGIAEYQEAAKLGKLQRVRAYIGIGMYYYRGGDYTNALKYLDDETTRANAIETRSALVEQQLFGFAGECARQLKDNAKAKERFEHVLGLDTSEGSHADARALANFGMGELSSDAAKRFDYYMTAAYWFEGQSKEADALLGALKVADSKKTTNADDEWSKRRAGTRAALQKLFPARLSAYEKGEG